MFVTPGTCSITASQPGNANYSAATPVTQTFAINPVHGSTASSITLSGSGSPATFGHPVTLTAIVTPAEATGSGHPAVSSGGGGGGGGGGAPGGGSALTVCPTSFTISPAVGGSPGSASVTLSYVKEIQGAPTFSSNFIANQGTGLLSVSPASANADPLPTGIANAASAAQASLAAQ